MPSRPSIFMYAYEISRMLALPHGAADIAWIAFAPPVGTTGSPGRYGARCAATPIGPMPGPPPPCGMLKVLCRLMWQTSAPIAAGLGKPTLAESVWGGDLHQVRANM